MPLHPFAVDWKGLGKLTFVFAQREGVGEDDAVKGRICRLHAAPSVVGLLDVDGGDVVGEEHDLVGVQLRLEFSNQVLVADQLRVLQQTHDKGAGAGERVENMHVLAGQPPPEMLLQGVVGRVQDEVHHLDRRVDDAETFGLLFEGYLEETLVELEQHLLPGLWVVQGLGAFAHCLVKRFQLARFVPQPLGFQQLYQPVQGARDGVAAHKVVIGEQRLEDRPRDQVLGHHRHQVLFLQRWIQRLSQVGQEVVEVLPQGESLRALDQTGDTGMDAFGDLGHVRGPLGPVLAVAAFLDDAGMDRAGWNPVHHVQGHLADSILGLAVVFAAADNLDAFGGGLVQVQRVDLQVKAVVVTAQGAQHAPHHLESFVVVQGLFRTLIRADHHR